MSILAPADLLARLDDPAIRLVDTRWYLGRPGDGRRVYEAGHLPGAIFLDLDTDLSAPSGPGRHPLPDAVDFGQRLAALGIGAEHLVVAYDDAGGGVAARLWWMLDDLGHERATVLDGGLAGWLAAGGELTTEPACWPPARLRLRESWARTIDCDELRSRLGRVTLLDARAPERYRGEVEPVDPVAGHIPTALNAPLSGNLDAGGRFRPRRELTERFRALGVADGPVVTSCGSGTNACQNALAMRLAGLPAPLLYPGSFSDWSRAGLPVATGDAPGLPLEDG